MNDDKQSSVKVRMRRILALAVIGVIWRHRLGNLLKKTHHCFPLTSQFGYSSINSVKTLGGLIIERASETSVRMVKCIFIVHCKSGMVEDAKRTPK